MIDDNTIKAIAGHCKYSSSVKGMRAMEEMAKSEVGIDQDSLNRDPWLINVRNGTVDLRTGKIRDHRREDFITQLAPIEFKPGAGCPVWTSFLDVIMASREDLISYLQRLVGLSITGVTTEHVLPFLYGTGANGKSTFVETILKMLGRDYAMKAPPDLVLKKKNEAHPTERADLFGKRFAACVEMEEGKQLAETLVKELTGGDTIRARRMRENFWEFQSTHHLWLAGNHKPVIQGNDHGIWRRLKLIPFEVVIPDEDQDKQLPEKLASELSGILNWAIRGCLDWQAEGLVEPDVVREATKEYRHDSDVIGEFLETCCETGPKCIVPATELYEAFLRETGSRISQNVFGAKLKLMRDENGNPRFTSERVTKGAYKGRKAWQGLTLSINFRVTKSSQEETIGE